jgi:hypothetical protein
VESAGLGLPADFHRGDRSLATHAPRLVAVDGIDETRRDAGMLVVPTPVGWTFRHRTPLSSLIDLSW